MRSPATVLCLLGLLTWSPAAAQGPSATQNRSSTTPDPEVMNYRLSMEKLRKLIQVQRALNALNAKNPQLFERIDRETKAMAKKKGAPLTVAQQVSIFDRYPEVRRAFAGVGGTARDWLLTGEAMGDAFVAVEIKKGTLSPETAPPPTTALKANVALLEKNEAEWKKILEELDRLSNELLE